MNTDLKIVLALHFSVAVKADATYTQTTVSDPEHMCLRAVFVHVCVL